MIMPKSPEGAWESSRLFQAGNLLSIAHHITVILGGCAYFFAISPALDGVLGHLWTGIMSMLVALFSLAALFARLVKAWRVEAVGLGVTAATLFIWGAIVIYASADQGYTSLQTGLMLIAGGFYRTGWIVTTLAYLDSDEAEINALRHEVADEIRRRIAGE